MTTLRVLLAAADNFFRCHWCNTPFLTQLGRDAHEERCAHNPANKR